MISALRRLPLRAALLLGLVVWFVGGFATQIHKAWVQHGTCSEGQVVELRGEHEAHSEPVLVKGHAHDEDCPLAQGLPTPEALRPMVLPVLEQPLVPSLPLRPATTPWARAVLSEAPKTSPPARG